MSISRIKVKFIAIAALLLLVLLLGCALLQWRLEYQHKKIALEKLTLEYNQKQAVPAQSSPGSPSSDYMLEVQRRIKAVWHPPRLSHDTENTVTFNIHKSGQISDERISKSSGSKSFDEATLATVRDASPVQPLPLAMACDEANVEFTFTYHVLPASFVGWILMVPPMDPILGWVLVALTAVTAFGLLGWLYQRERDAVPNPRSQWKN